MKKILYILLLLAGTVQAQVAPTTGTKFGGAIIRNAPGDQYALGYADLFNGGFHSGATYHSRDSLVTYYPQLLRHGMYYHVYTRGVVDSLYQWSGLTWLPVTFGTNILSMNNSFTGTNIFNNTVGVAAAIGTNPSSPDIGQVFYIANLNKTPDTRLFGFGQLYTQAYIRTFKDTLNFLFGANPMPQVSLDTNGTVIANQFKLRTGGSSSNVFYTDGSVGPVSGGGGTVTGGAINWPGTIYTTPTAGTVSSGVLTFAPSLANQSARTFLGNHTGGSGVPTFAALSVGGDIDTTSAGLATKNSLIPYLTKSQSDTRYVDLTTQGQSAAGKKFTSLVDVNYASPEFRLTTSSDSLYASFGRTTSGALNLFQVKNKVLQVGGVGKSAIFNAANTQYGTVDLSNIASTTPTGITVSIWFKTTSAGGIVNMVIPYIGLEVINSNTIAYGAWSGSTRTFTGSFNVTDGQWHHFLVSTSASGFYDAFLDGTQYVNQANSLTMPTISSGTPFDLGRASLTGGNNYYTGEVDQLLVYTRALNTTSGSGGTNEVATVYNSGSGTASPPLTGLVRRYEFEEGTGNVINDINPNVSQVPVTINNGVGWDNIGKVPISATSSESSFLTNRNGTTNGERGITGIGDSNGRLEPNLRWLLAKQGVNSPWMIDNFGNWMISPNYTGGYMDLPNALNVVGSTYIGSSPVTAPTNGLVVEGYTKIGKMYPGNQGVDSIVVHKSTGGLAVIAADQSLGNGRVNNQSASMTLATITVVNNGIYNISLASRIITFSVGSVDFTVNWTDINGYNNTRSFYSQGATGSGLMAANAISNFPPMSIEAAAGSNITITTTVTGSLTYSASYKVR